MDREFLIDLFSHFGPVAIRRMFSGFGISADGTNFALARFFAENVSVQAPSLEKSVTDGAEAVNGADAVLVG